MADAPQPADARPLVVLPALRVVWRGLVWLVGRARPIVARGAAACGRALWRHRGVVGAITVRALWVGALLLLVEGGRAVLQIEQPLDPIALRQTFGVGLGLCSVTVLLAAHRRIRWAGVALGTAHGALVLVLGSATS